MCFSTIVCAPSWLDNKINPVIINIFFIDGDGFDFIHLFLFPLPQIYITAHFDEVDFNTASPAMVPSLTFIIISSSDNSSTQ
jgi:hypothetical protein